MAEWTWETLESQCKKLYRLRLGRDPAQRRIRGGQSPAEVLFIGEGPGETRICRGNPLWGGEASCWTKCWRQ